MAPQAMSDLLLTEEDLRGKVLLPYLRALGFGPDQIALETKFSIRLGKSRHPVADCFSRHQVRSGRSDCIVRSILGRSLFLVEVKAHSQALSDNDRDQGISYARLLDDIAPFVLLTNGQETKVFETITREEIQSLDGLSQAEFWRNNCVLASSDDLRIRREALRHFIGYSQANVQALSRLQQRQRMLGLLGSKADTTKKYIPEIYVEREQVREAVDAFLLRGEPVFALVGDAGVGKTNELCALADYLGKRHIALFFSANAIADTLGRTLADEFNWFFSEYHALEQIVRNLEMLVAGTESKIVILLDGLDEVEVRNFPASLSDFGLRLIHSNGSIKLIVSCKSTDWSRFATFRDEPSGLAIAMCPNAHDVRSESDAIPAYPKKWKPEPMYLTALSASEGETFLDRYVSFFALPERPQGQLKMHCHSPFLLRVASELYGGRIGRLPSDISVGELCDAWLEKKFTRMPERARAGARVVLREFGLALCALPPSDESYPDDEDAADGLWEDELCRRCGLPITQTVADDLVSQGVLARMAKGGRPLLRFYYSEVRNFFFARQALGLQDWTADRLRDDLLDLLGRYVTCEALYWHLTGAPISHIEALSTVAEGRVLLFLSSYERSLDKLGRGIRQGVDPFTSGAIGLAYEVRERELHSWGLFSCVGGGTRIREIRRHNSSETRGPSDSFMSLGGVTTHFGGTGLLTDPESFAARYAHEAAMEAIRRGQLDETSSLTLQKERVWALVSRSECWRFLKHYARDKWSDGGRPMIGGRLDLEEIARRFQVAFGEDSYPGQEANGRGERTGVLSWSESARARSWAETQVDAGAYSQAPRLFITRTY